jgi:hypothetical protein
MGLNWCLCRSRTQWSCRPAIRLRREEETGRAAANVTLAPSGSHAGRRAYFARKGFIAKHFCECGELFHPEVFNNLDARVRNLPHLRTSLPKKICGRNSTAAGRNFLTR